MCVCVCVLDAGKQTWAGSAGSNVRFTWMRHLLTSLAQRALLQPEVRASPDRRKRRAAAAAAAGAGRVVSPGLILTAHQLTFLEAPPASDKHQHGSSKHGNPPILQLSPWYLFCLFSTIFHQLLMLKGGGGKMCMWKHNHNKKNPCVLRREALLQLQLHQGVYHQNLRDFLTNTPKNPAISHKPRL